MKLFIIGMLMFIMGIEFQKIKTCTGKYDFDYGVCRER